LTFDIGRLRFPFEFDGRLRFPFEFVGRLRFPFEFDLEQSSTLELEVEFDARDLTLGIWML
jgi:hypothetical protein